MKRLLAIVAIMPSLALAQTPSPDMLAMQNRILREVSDNLSCNAAAITAQRKIEELEARLKPAEEHK